MLRSFVTFAAIIVSVNCAFSDNRVLFKRNGETSGEGTFYDPNGGFGACGTRLQNNDMVCALGFDYHATVGCGACLEVTGPLGSVIVRVADKCEGCRGNDVDLTRGAFKLIASEAAGRVQVRSRIVPCNGGGSVAPPKAAAAVSAVARNAAPELNVKSVSTGRCSSNSDCPANSCCSTHGFCGVGPDFCTRPSEKKAPAEPKEALPAKEEVKMPSLPPVPFFSPKTIAEVVGSNVASGRSLNNGKADAKEKSVEDDCTTTSSAQNIATSTVCSATQTSAAPEATAYGGSTSYSNGFRIVPSVIIFVAYFITLML